MTSLAASRPTPSKAPAPVLLSASPPRCPGCGRDRDPKSADVGPAWRCACGGDVGFADAFVDDGGRRQPLRHRFRHEAAQPSACCGHVDDPVLVGLRPGRHCGACGALVLRQARIDSGVKDPRRGPTSPLWRHILQTSTDGGGVGGGVDVSVVVAAVIVLGGALALARLWLGQWPS